MNISETAPSFKEYVLGAVQVVKKLQNVSTFSLDISDGENCDMGI